MNEAFLASKPAEHETCEQANKRCPIAEIFIVNAPVRETYHLCGPEEPFLNSAVELLVQLLDIQDLTLSGMHIGEVAASEFPQYLR